MQALSVPTPPTLLATTLHDITVVAAKLPRRVWLGLTLPWLPSVALAIRNGGILDSGAGHGRSPGIFSQAVETAVVAPLSLVGLIAVLVATRHAVAILGGCSTLVPVRARKVVNHVANLFLLMLVFAAGTAGVVLFGVAGMLVASLLVPQAPALGIATGSVWTLSGAALLGAMLCTVLPVVVVEDKQPLQALKRAFQLFAHEPGGAIVHALVYVIALPCLAVGLQLGLSLISASLAMGVGAVANTVVLILTTFAHASLYYRLRCNAPMREVG